MRRLLAILVAALVLAVAGNSAFAQGASCPISLSSPVSSTATSYTLSASDNCKMIVFTSGSAVTVTPATPSTTLPPGFTVKIKAQGAGGVTFATAPGGILTDGASGPIAVTQGKGIEVRTDGTNYFTMGIGVIHP